MRISDWSSDVCSSDLLGRGRLLVEDVEHVEEELDLADRERLGVLQAHVQGVVRRSSFAANGTLLDPAVEHAAVLVGIVHHRKVAAADQVGAAVEHTAVPVEQDAGLETEVPVVSAQRLRSEEHTSELQSLMRI